MNNKRVIKIGGSVLKNTDDLLRFVEIVKLYDSPIVIVVSAFSGVTDLLINELQSQNKSEQSIRNLISTLKAQNESLLVPVKKNDVIFSKASMLLEVRLKELERLLLACLYIGEVPQTIHDLVLSYGERLSSLVCNAILEYSGLKCREQLPEDLNLLVKEENGNVSVDIRSSEVNVRERLGEDCYFVVPGFYGITKTGKVRLLGRGGSDYSAAAIARCIFAASLDLWKDCEGFLSADPKLVPQAQSIKHLHYDEAAELSYFGAKILHPRTVEPIKEKAIPIRIYQSLNRNPDDPSTIIDEKLTIVPNIIKSVTYSDDFCILKLIGAGIGIQHGIMAKITEKLEAQSINIKSILTSQTTINILLSRSDLKLAFHILTTDVVSFIDEVETIDDITTIAVVGNGMLTQHGIAAKMFSALSDKKINVEMISFGASKVVTYFIVKKQYRNEAILAIHNAFFN